MQRSVRGEVYSSTFDLPAQNHVRVAEIVIEKQKRLVEMRKDVVILLDSITRLARAYNTVTQVLGKYFQVGLMQMLYINQKDSLELLEILKGVEV